MSLRILRSILKKTPAGSALIKMREEILLKFVQFNPSFSWGRLNPLLDRNKLDLIDFVFTTNKTLSFADLGSIWRVSGGYTFYTLNKYHTTKAVLVDTAPIDTIMKQSKKYAQLRLIQGNFGDQSIAQEIGEVDAIFLFDVLLHQVAPDWDKILEIYAAQTRCLVIFNQQWVGSESTIRLLDLGEREYFQNVPHDSEEGQYQGLFQKLDQIAPGYNRKWRDIHHLWQWGITDQGLKEKIHSLGFSQQYFKNCGKFGNLKNFENHAFVFTK